MKVLFILKEFPKLSETFILNQITGLIDRGIDLHILALNNPNEGTIHKELQQYNITEKYLSYYDNYQSIFDKVKIAFKKIKELKPNKYIYLIKPLRYKSLRDITLITTFLNLERNFDIIHTHFGFNGYLALRIKKYTNFNGKIITSFYGIDLGKHIKNNKDMYKELAKEGDYFLPICEYFSNILIDLSFPKHKIKIHRLGININSFSFKQRDKKNKIKLLTVARLVEKKGLEYSIKTLSGIIHQYKNIEYHIIGSGELLNYLKNLTIDNKIGNNVFFHGDKANHEVKEYMYTSDIFVLPSVTAENGDIEGTPTSILEAMACGLPVISTNHSGIPELIKNNQTGILCNEKDVISLGKSLNELIKNPQKRYKLSLNARKYVEKYHNIDILNNSLLDIYESLSN